MNIDHHEAASRAECSADSSPRFMTDEEIDRVREWLKVDLRPEDLIPPVRRTPAFYSARRKATIRKRTPRWADQAAIAAIYSECREIGERTGVAHQVDHVVPLHGRLVSGLHVTENLQIIPADQNQRKYNAFEP